MNDPLIQSNIFLYINELTRSSDHKYKFSVISFEDRNIPISEIEKDKLNREFLKRNITWEPLNWHSGDSLIIKFIDLTLAFFKLLKLRISGYKHCVTLGSIAGSFIYIISRIIPIKYYLYQYEPHSEYLEDTKVWNKESLQFKILNKLERNSVMKCAVVSSGTNYMQERLESWKVNNPFYKVTSVANDKLFNYSEKLRLEIRNQLNVSEEQKLIIYPGKVGGVYANAQQLILLIKEMSRLNENFRFLIVTPNSLEVLNEIEILAPEIKSLTMILPPLSLEKMPAYLSAADLGIVSVLPGASQKFRSNIKVGEYLCAGLPYLICQGISEDDLIAENNSVGIVIKDLKPEFVREANAKINSILSIPKTEIAIRCRDIGLNYRGFTNQHQQFTKALQSLIES